MRLTLFGVCAVLGVGCASSTAVTRMVNGRRVEGRFVTDEAYAAYVNGVVLETTGRVEEALAAYKQALAYDPESVELWTRLGALRCAADPTSSATASGDPWDAFAHASRIDPAYEETWTEVARCHLRHGQIEEAARAARVATSLDPDRSEPVLLLTQILERQGRVGEARQWLDGLLAREPDSIDANEAMLTFAARTHDDARREAAARVLSESRRDDDGSSQKRARPSLSEIDAALVRGHFERARTLALAAQLGSGALSLRAAALGIVPFASDQARSVLAADPANSDARVAAAVSADLERDEALLARSLSDLPAASSPLSPLATLLMGELLARRAGPDVRDAWTLAAGAVPEADDPLLRVVARRK